MRVPGNPTYSVLCGRRRSEHLIHSLFCQGDCWGRVARSLSSLSHWTECGMIVTIQTRREGDGRISRSRAPCSAAVLLGPEVRAAGCGPDCRQRAGLSMSRVYQKENKAGLPIWRDVPARRFKAGQSDLLTSVLHTGARLSSYVALQCHDTPAGPALLRNPGPRLRLPGEARPAHASPRRTEDLVGFPRWS